MLYTEVTLHLPSTLVEAVSNLLIAAGCGGFEVSDASDFNEFIETVTPHWDYVDEKLMEKKTAPTFIRLYLADNAQSDALMADITRRIDADDVLQGAVTISKQTVDDGQWTDNWKQYYKPIEIGDRLAIVPQWEEYTPKEKQAVLRIDPGAAFGTGSHETTALCLKLLHDMDLSGVTVLDVGCGSGILSCAALLLGAASAIGVDIDELAVSASQKNAQRNGLEQQTKFICGDLAGKVDGKFAVVTANIVADVLLQLLPDIGDKMIANGIIILSGILEERTAEICRAAQSFDFTVLKTITQGGWSAVVCQKRG